MLKKIETKIIPILEKYENIEQLVEEVDNSLEIINQSNESVAFSMLNELYQKYNLQHIQTG